MAERIPCDALQKWFFETLDADARLTGNVFDHAPTDTPFPTIEIGLYELENTDEKTFGRQILFQRVNVYSTADGMKELNDAANAVVEALTQATPPESGGNAVGLADDFLLELLRFDNAEVDKEEHPRTGGVVRVGVLRFKCYVSDTRMTSG